MWSHSKICGYIRRFIVNIPVLRDALLCPPCASFWVGILVSMFFNPLEPLITIPAIYNIFVATINYAVCGILYKSEILKDD